MTSRSPGPGWAWRSRALFVATAAAVLALAGWGVYVGSRHLWADYHIREARRLAAARDFSGALDHLWLCQQIQPNRGDVHFLVARTARRAGRGDDAAAALEVCKALKYAPDAVSLERALLRAQQGDLDVVQGYLRGCVEQGHPDAVLILEALTQGYLKTYQLPAAVRCLDEWLERQPDEVQALVWRAETCDRLQRSAEAIADYGRAVAREPGRADLRLALARLLLQANRAPEALDHLGWLHDQQPDEPAALLGLARGHRQLGQTDEARQLLDALLAAHPEDAEALAERGQLELAAQQPAEAEGWLRRAVAAAPFERQAVYSYLLCLEQLGKEDAAKDLRARLQQIDADLRRLAEVTRQVPAAPRDADLRCEAGMILLRNGQDKEGLRWLNSALEQNPGHRASHKALAEYFERQGQAEEAARHRRLAG